MRTSTTGAIASVFLLAAAGCHSGANETKTESAKPAAAVSSPAPEHPKAVVTMPAQAFEGAITLDVIPGSSGPPTESLTYDIKGSRVHYAETKQKKPTGVQAIADLNAHKTYAILDSHKAYVELDKVAASTTPPAAVTKLGKTETIAGLPCEDWQVAGGKRRVDVCATRSIPYVDLMARPRKGEQQPAWATALEKDNAFPLRVVEYDDAGKLALSATASWVARRPEADSLFEVPKGYRLVDLPPGIELPGLP